MFKIEDKYGRNHGVFNHLEDAKKLAVSLGNEKLCQLMEYSYTTDTVLHAEMSIGVYPYNGEKGMACFHVCVGDYDDEDNFVEENYFDVIIED